MFWQQELDPLYDACKAAATGKAVDIVIDEQTSFYTHLADLEKELNLLYPGNPAFVEEKLSEVLMNKVVDMCYLLHTAPGDRVDSYITGNYEVIDGISMDYDNFTRKILKVEGSDVSYMVVPCTEHCENNGEALSLIASTKDTEAAFAQAGELWIDMINKRYRNLYEGHGGSERDVMAGECRSYYRWIDAYAPLLLLFYPDRPEIVSEMLYHALRDKCIDLCGITGS